MLLFAPYFVLGRRDKHSCSASAIINLSMVSMVDSLLSTIHVSANRILRCEANAYFIGSGYAGSLFFFLRLPPLFLASRGFAAQRSRARALPLLNLKISCTNSALDSSNSRIRAKTYLLWVPNLVSKRSTLIHF